MGGAVSGRVERRPSSLPEGDQMTRSMGGPSTVGPSTIASGGASGADAEPVGATVGVGALGAVVVCDAEGKGAVPRPGEQAERARPRMIAGEGRMITSA